eukprot:Awhi_evm1s11475
MSDMEVEFDVTERVKSKVTSRRGRGFTSEREEDNSKYDSITSSKDGAGGGASTEQRSVEGWILIVGGLHEEIAEDHIHNHFGEYGEIKNLHLNVDRRTGFVKGYCLIEYETHEEAANAIKFLNGTNLLERKLVVDWAFVRPPTDASNNSNRNGRRGGQQ